MNRSKVQEQINQIIEEARKRKPARKQYPAAKHQITSLTELGIIDMMPADYGYLDAAMVVEAAQETSTAVFNASGEGEAVAASTLYQLLNETEESEASAGSIIQKAIQNYSGTSKIEEFNGHINIYTGNEREFVSIEWNEEEEIWEANAYEEDGIYAKFDGDLEYDSDQTIDQIEKDIREQLEVTD